MKQTKTEHPDRRPRVLVVQPDPNCPVDRLGDWLVAAGLELDVVFAWRGGTLALGDADGLIVLGGDMSAHDEADHPWLAEVRSLLAEAMERELPTLGICLGGQLLALAGGGRVVLGDRGLEAGVIDLVVSADGTGDPLFGELPPRFASGAYHRDAIEVLPPGAVLLASSSMYPHQGYRLGSRCWGLQFHPEVSAKSYAGWLDYTATVDPDIAQRLEPTRADFEERDEEVVSSGQVLARRFAEVVSDAAIRLSVPDQLAD